MTPDQEDPPQPQARGEGIKVVQVICIIVHICYIYYFS